MTALARSWGPGAVGVAAAVGCAVLALVDPNEPGRYPLCPFRLLTGLDCPGCGTLRAVHALTRGQLGTALDHNVVTVVLLPVLLAGWLLWLWRARSGRPAPALPASAGYAVAGLLAVFWVVRNLPWAPWDALGSGLV